MWPEGISSLRRERDSSSRSKLLNISWASQQQEKMVMGKRGRGGLIGLGKMGYEPLDLIIISSNQKVHSPT